MGTAVQEGRPSMEMMLMIEADLDAGLQDWRDLLWALMLPYRLRAVN